MSTAKISSFREGSLSFLKEAPVSPQPTSRHLQLEERPRSNVRTNQKLHGNLTFSPPIFRARRRFQGGRETKKFITTIELTPIPHKPHCCFLKKQNPKTYIIYLKSIKLSSSENCSFFKIEASFFANFRVTGSLEYNEPALLKSILVNFMTSAAISSIL